MTSLQSTVTRSFVFTELSGAFYQTDIFELFLLENTVKRRRMIVFSKYFAPHYQCDILELLL